MLAGLLANAAYIIYYLSVERRRGLKDEIMTEFLIDSNLVAAGLLAAVGYALA